MAVLRSATPRWTFASSRPIASSISSSRSTFVFLLYLDLPSVRRQAPHDHIFRCELIPGVGGAVATPRNLHDGDFVGIAGWHAAPRGWNDSLRFAHDWSAFPFGKRHPPRTPQASRSAGSWPYVHLHVGVWHCGQETVQIALPRLNLARAISPVHLLPKTRSFVLGRDEDLPHPPMITVKDEGLRSTQTRGVAF